MVTIPALNAICSAYDDSFAISTLEVAEGTESDRENEDAGGISTTSEWRGISFAQDVYEFY